jgi:glutamate/tyrosine decarboxylase-like PLP-dependent enzyme
VDACVGGMMLPFVAKLGYPVPEFDFQAPGVTSLSVDLHKYGYAAKGASVILFANPELRRHMFFVQTDWPGGIYVSPTMAGTRPGGAIAAAWAVMNYLGEDGYLRIADQVMGTAVKLRDGINATRHLRVLGQPDMSILAIGADKGDIFEVGDEMGLRGWHLDRQQAPNCLHVTVNYAHVATADQFLLDLWASAAAAARPSLHRFSTGLQVGAVRWAARVLPPGVMSRLTAASSSLTGVEGASLPTRSAAMYGMMAELPSRGDVDQLVLDLLDGMTREG